jgi:hypothetical protein
MANGRDDLRLALGWVDHIKTTRLVLALGADAALGLLRLWSYAATNHPQGVLASPEDVEAVARWTGKPGELLSALKRLRWLEKDGVTLHDWPSEQPWIFNRDERVRAAKLSGREGGLRSAASRKSKGTLDGTLDQPSRVASAYPQPPSSPLLSSPEERRDPERAGETRSPFDSAPGPRAGAAAGTGATPDPDRLQREQRQRLQNIKLDRDLTLLETEKLRALNETLAASTCTDCRANPRAPGRAICGACLERASRTHATPAPSTPS